MKKPTAANNLRVKTQAQAMSCEGHHATRSISQRSWQISSVDDWIAKGSQGHQGNQVSIKAFERPIKGLC